MAINKTAAGTYVVDFRDQSGKRIRKTFDRLEDARNYNKQSLGDISKVTSLRLPTSRSRISPRPGTGERKTPGPIATGRSILADSH